MLKLHLGVIASLESALAEIDAAAGTADVAEQELHHRRGADMTWGDADHTPVLGRLSDRHGRRLVFLISIFGTFLGFLILGFAGSLWWLFASRILSV